MVLSASDPDYRQCTITVMDNIADPDITFDENGICNYLYQYKKLENEILLPLPQRTKQLEEIIQQIKSAGRGKKYDCITGVSGGIDSTYLILMAKKWGLRPLIVHFDNGWNSETAVKNINNIIQKTGFDLYTIVVNWQEFRDLQLAYMKSGVVDWEVPTDHAIFGTWYKLAKKYGIDTVLNGNNMVTEEIIPPSWNFNKADYTNLLGIHKKFGTIPLKTYPVFSFWQQYYMRFVKRVREYKLLNYVDFNKQAAKEEIKEQFGWVDYGGKHYESVFTKFYQAYVLPQRLKIDKRKAHLSNLILSGQLSREEAMAELQQPLYSQKELVQEKEYVLKKLGLSPQAFEEIMQIPLVPHAQYGVQPFITDRFRVLKLIRPVYRMFK